MRLIRGSWFQTSARKSAVSVRPCMDQQGLDLSSWAGGYKNCPWAICRNEHPLTALYGVKL